MFSEFTGFCYIFDTSQNKNNCSLTNIRNIWPSSDNLLPKCQSFILFMKYRCYRMERKVFIRKKALKVALDTFRQRRKNNNYVYVVVKYLKIEVEVTKIMENKR